jgi:quercetin dioxygenase-like cupin family protein
MRRHSAALLLIAVVACHRAGADNTATAATSGVTRADSGIGARDPRFIPLTPFPGDVQLLLGDPDSAGPFVMRIHELPGTIVPPHSHPVDEHITVVQGTWLFGIGDKFDSTALRRLPTGSYAFAPAGTSMFAASPEDAIVQVHGVGPFHIKWAGGLATFDEPGSTLFRFRRGARVLTPLGPGTIREGYASGSVIQYELVAADGHRFMASESDVRQDVGTPPGAV